MKLTLSSCSLYFWSELSSSLTYTLILYEFLCQNIWLHQWDDSTWMNKRKNRIKSNNLFLTLTFIQLILFSSFYSTLFLSFLTSIIVLLKKSNTINKVVLISHSTFYSSYKISLHHKLILQLNCELDMILRLIINNQ